MGDLGSMDVSVWYYGSTDSDDDTSTADQRGFENSIVHMLQPVVHFNTPTIILVLISHDILPADTEAWDKKSECIQVVYPRQKHSVFQSYSYSKLLLF